MATSHDAPSGSFLIFGASGGIGSAVVRTLVAKGERVVAVARNVERIESMDLGAARIAAGDVGNPEDVAASLALAQDVGDGVLSGIALCVGSILLKPAHLTTDAEWEELLLRNLTSAFHVARAAGKVMRKGGSVVFCSTAAASVGLANHDGIAAVKAGVEGLVRSAAATYAARGLRFNAVAPGLVRTDLSASITGNERALEMSRAMHALGRIGEPEDVASAICWLLDPANSWISGDTIRVDGGLAQLRPVAKR